jgi:hypothetical protein
MVSLRRRYKPSLPAFIFANRADCHGQIKDWRVDITRRMANLLPSVPWIVRLEVVRGIFLFVGRH